MGTDFLRAATRAAERAGRSADGLATAVDERLEHRGHFANWDQTAAVRSRPLRRLSEPRAETIFFPPEMVPTHDHPLVAGRGGQVQRRLLVHALYNYLHFTTELEDLAVIPVAVSISRGRSGLELPVRARRDAYHIVTDEAWHAQFSHELHRQVSELTGEPVPPSREPMFLDRLEKIADELRTNVPAIGRLLFAVVSETLVSSLLGAIPHDARLPAAVRETVADHAADEGRHHAYFRDILRFLWRALTPSERAHVGPWLPTIILAFLEPDYRASADALAAVGLDVEEVEAALQESYPRAAVLAQAAGAARPTIRYLAEVGALDDPATADAFAVFDVS